MFARHDLIWLTPLGWHAQLAAHPRPLGAPVNSRAVPAPGFNTAGNAGDTAAEGGDLVQEATSAAVMAARSTLEQWRDHNWPLIIRRCQPGLPEGCTCAGLAAPPDRTTGVKQRIPLVIDRRHIARHERPLPLHAVLPALPQRLQEDFAAFMAAAEDFDMRVYGSLAMQALTGQPYFRPASDIDIVFRPASVQALDAGVAILAAHAANLPLDGEIVFPSGEAVSWKEWQMGQAADARVLVKKASCVLLRPATAMRMELEAA